MSSFKVLVTDSIHQACVDYLRQHKNITVDFEPSFGREEILASIGNYDGIAVRSKNGIDAEMIAKAKKLKVIARAGVGVDHIDVQEASKRGITVVNSPRGNIVTAAEHTLALMLAVHRHVCLANASVRDNKWERKKFLGRELFEKTLGVIGLGKIGSLVAARAQAFGMEILAYDPFVTEEYAQARSATLVDLPTLLGQADIVTLHVPLTDLTRNMIGEKELALMKEGAYLMNVSRGKVVDIQALAKALQSGKLRGAGIDVFPEEPVIDSPLFACPNAVLTPHLGGNTDESQIRIAHDIAQGIVDVLQENVPLYAVNSSITFPTDNLAFYEPYLQLAKHLGTMLPQLAEGSIGVVEITYAGDIAQQDTDPLKAYILMGILEKMGVEQVNLINVLYLCQERSISVVEKTSSEDFNFSSLVTVKVITEKEEYTLAGTVMRNEPHLVRIDDFWIDIKPEGYLLVTTHHDQPGVIGDLGTLLGNAGVNIASMEVGRSGPRESAVMVVTLDERPSEKTLEQIRKNPKMKVVKIVEP